MTFAAFLAESDIGALFAAAATHPLDALPRLVAADWLDENGFPETAKAVRLLAERPAPDYRDAMSRAVLELMKQGGVHADFFLGYGMRRGGPGNVTNSVYVGRGKGGTTYRTAGPRAWKRDKATGPWAEIAAEDLPVAVAAGLLLAEAFEMAESTGLYSARAVIERRIRSVIGSLSLLAEANYNREPAGCRNLAREAGHITALVATINHLADVLEKSEDPSLDIATANMAERHWTVTDRYNLGHALAECGDEAGGRAVHKALGRIAEWRHIKRRS